MWQFIVWEHVLKICLTVGVWVDLCKGPQGETDAVLRAGEAHIPKERRHHQVLICGVCAEKEEKLPTMSKMLFIQRYCSRWYITVTTKYSSFSHQYVALHHMKPFMLSRHWTLWVSSITWANRWPHPQCGEVYNKHLWEAISAPQSAGPPCWCRWWWPYAPELHVWSDALCSASPGQRDTRVWVIWKLGELRHMCR